MNLATRVSKTFTHCLFRGSEIEPGKTPENAVIVEGLTFTVGFHPERLAESKEEVKSILREMDPNFHREGGGGWTFLNLCMDKHGEQWAEQKTCQELVLLAIGLKLGSYTLPRFAWSSLPGGVPFVSFDLEETFNGSIPNELHRNSDLRGDVERNSNVDSK